MVVSSGQSSRHSWSPTESMRGGGWMRATGDSVPLDGVVRPIEEAPSGVEVSRDIGATSANSRGEGEATSVEEQASTGSGSMRAESEWTELDEEVWAR